jgi:hypothetical protein
MRTKHTHPLDVSYLVMGLIFLGLAGLWALREGEVIDLGEMQWLLPLSLIVAGVIGLAAAAAKSRSRRSSDTHGESDPEWAFHDHDDERSL